MSTQTETTEGPEIEGAETDEAQATTREAQRLRARARDAEAERDALAARVAEHQRAEVLRLAGQHLAHAEDLLTLGGVEVADLLDEGGNVDTARVQTAAAALVEARGARFAVPVKPADYDGGVRTNVQPAASWSSVLAGRSGSRR